MELILSAVAFAVSIAMLFGSINCVGIYTIAAPEYIRPHSDYTVSVTLHNSTEPMKLRLAIEDGLNYKNEKIININSSQTELFKLHIDDLNITNGYKFVAEGLSGLKFRDESTLRVEPKNVSIFIQTDKGLYKPGETVRFRVIVLDSLLKPVKLTPDNLLNIHLSDPEKNSIKQWQRVNLKKGVFSGEIDLSKLQVLGDWTFEARIGQETKTKSIEVAKYVLNNFDVTIDSPNDFSAKDGKIRAIICLKYTHGNLIKGKAIVTLSPKEEPFPVYHSRRKPVDKIQKTIPINGKATVEFDSDEAMSLNAEERYDVRSFDLQATVIDELTGRNSSASKTIRVYTSRYKITTSYDRNGYIPGMNFELSLSITHHDNSPILISEKTKKIKISYEYTPTPRKVEYEFELNDEGVANIILPTVAHENEFYLEVTYMDEQIILGYILNRYTGEPTDMDVRVLTKRPALNKMIEVEVRSRDIFQNLTCYVIAHGKVVYAKDIALPSSRRQTFQIKTTFDFVPRATIVVYQIIGDGIASAKANIQIDDELMNFVKVTLPTEMQPGNDIDIGIYTNPDSFVGLLGIDQSVLLLKNDDELTKEKVFEEMRQYQRSHDTDHRSCKEYRSFDDIFKIFEDYEIIFFTNAKKPEDHHPMVAIFGAPDIPRKVVKPPRVRTDFAETWLWEDFDLNNGSVSITRKVPDTITSWVITAFSVNPQTGLGLTKTPKSLNVFQPFFIALSLPYSVKHGEIVAVPLVLFNYLSSNISAELVLHNENNEFEFIDGTQSNQTLRKRQVSIAADGGISETFLIRFNSIGKIALKITAKSAVAADAVVRILQVDPEGVPQYINKAVFVDLRESNAYNFTQTIDVPSNAVPGSLKINVDAIGNVFGGTVKNLNQLIRLPTGYEQQNMLNFVPNIVVLECLSAVDKLDESIKNKTIKYLVSGYQRELNYSHYYGSYSAFGKSDARDSTWLTAFVVRSFKQAEKYIDIDSKVIDDALKWLCSIQADDGSFPETGDIIDHKLQGGSSKGIALTAYTTIAFLINKKSKDWPYQETVSKALQNIATTINDIEDVYTLAVAAYALQLANHTEKDSVLDKLASKAVITDHQKYWTKSEKTTSEVSKSINIEIAAYGVLALIQANRSTKILPYLTKWLLAQRNYLGAFVSTQDTVVGLEALATYGRIFSSKNNDIQLQIKTNTTADKSIKINQKNALLLQTIDLPSDTKSVSVSATGHGFALFQLSYRYNLNGNDSRSTFTLTPKIREITTGHLNLAVCASYNPTKEDALQSNIVIVEVAMPSGFLIEKENLNKLLEQPNIKLVESKHGDTVSDIYLDRMQQDQEICIEVQGYRSHKVAENKPVPVRIYDYYDNSRSATSFYEIASYSAYNHIF